MKIKNIEECAMKISTQAEEFKFGISKYKKHKKSGIKQMYKEYIAYNLQLLEKVVEEMKAEMEKKD